MSNNTRLYPLASNAVGTAQDGQPDDLENVIAAPEELRALRRLLREAEAARAVAEQANAAKDKLLAALAHELRTPLASILLHAQLLREGDIRDRPDLVCIGDSLERAVKQQTQLIDRLDKSLKASRELTAVTPALQANPDQTTPPPRRSLDRPGMIKQYDGLRDVRILYIDDDFMTREAVLEVLELTGARVALAASTADGMMALETFKPHVIVCDLSMPGEDGYVFMRKLRAYEARQDTSIPVLAFTGLSSAEDKRDALAAGFQMYLSKPIDIDRLRDSVAQLVELAGTLQAESTLS